MKLLIESAEQVEYLTEEVNGKKQYFIEGIFLQSELENKNGRIYPKNILDKEVARYIKECINDNTAVGELSHCYANNDFEILTPNGWVKFNNIKIGDIIYNINEENKFVEDIITDKIEKVYTGKYIRFSGKNIESTVTPNHRFYLLDRYGNKKIHTAEEILNDPKKFSKYKIIKLVDFVGENKKYYTIKKIDSTLVHKSRYKQPVWEDLTISTELWCSFLGLWLAEGCISNDNNNYNVNVSQNTGKKLNKILKLYDKLGFDYYTTKPTPYGNVNINFSDRRIHEYLKQFGKCRDKFIPNDIKKLSPQYLEKLFEYFALGDGRHLKDDRIQDVFTISEQLINDLQEIQIKFGGHGNINLQIPTKDYFYDNHLLEAKNCHPLYILTYSTTTGIWLDTRHPLTIEYVENTSGMAYCVSAKNGNFYIRDNGKTYLTGNSASALADPRLISHKIISLKESGNDYVGKALVLDTPNGKIVKSLMEGGVKFGVSSKGLGTIQERNGKKYVSEDYKLSTAADIVLSPSAPNAWVTPIMESTEYDMDQNGLIYEIKSSISNAKTKSQLEEARLSAFKKLLNLIK